MTQRWKDLFPYGRTIFYEGDDPEGFRKEIIERFKFDPFIHSKDWKAHYAEFKAVMFHCPPEHLDKIYTQYDTGS